MDLDVDISQYHVVIVEDIIDSGRTLSEIVKILQVRNPLSLHVVTLLDKPARRQVDFSADYSLFTIEDRFVIGYGLDCAEYYRTLPYIAEYAE
jgi:hypoxanthine phosphoribosyltransferase